MSYRNNSLLKLIKTKAGSVISWIMLVNAILAVTALLKDILTAHYLGTTAQADALLLAYFIPDNIGNILFSAAIGTACVPIFTKVLIREGDLRLHSCVRNINYSMSFIAVLLCIAFYFMSYDLVNLLGDGFVPEIKDLFNRLFLIVLPTVLIFPAFSIGSAALQVYNKFIIVAMAPVLFNIPFISTVIYAIYINLPIADGVYLLAFSLTGGVLVMFALIWGYLAILKGNNYQDFFRLPSRITQEESRDIKDILRIFIQYFLILLSTQSILYAERYLASFLEAGSIAGLNYAYRIALFPLWVFVTAISAVILPTVSRYSGLGRKKGVEAIVSKAFYTSLVIILPMAITICMLRIPIITILLKRGAFNDKSLEITAAILAGYSLAIIGQTVLHIGLRVFLALEKLLLPVLICFGAALLTVLLDIYLVKRLGAAGLGYGAAIGACINAAGLLYILKRYLDFPIPHKLKRLGYIICANIPVFFIALLGNRIWTVYFQNKEFFSQFGYLAATAFLCSAVYLICLWRLKIL